jgi:hypothetical protein
MFVFAIETCGKTVAFTKEVDRIMLDGVLNGAREERQYLRHGLLSLRETIGTQVWDGISPFTARLTCNTCGTCGCCKGCAGVATTVPYYPPPFRGGGGTAV